MAKTLIKIGALTVDAANYEIPIKRTFRAATTPAELKLVQPAGLTVE